jgi:hypothetical protein
MENKKSMSKTKAVLLCLLIGFAVAIIIAFIHIIFKINFHNYFSMIITGALIGLAISLSSRYLYKKSDFK